MRRVILAMACLALAASAEAQTAEIVTVYRQGSTTPASAPVTLDRAYRVCGRVLGAVPTTTTVNARIAQWPDPAVPSCAVGRGADPDSCRGGVSMELMGLDTSSPPVVLCRLCSVRPVTPT